MSFQRTLRDGRVVRDGRERSTLYFWLTVAYGSLITLILASVSSGQQQPATNPQGQEPIQQATKQAEDDSIASQIRLATAGMQQRQKFKLEYKYQPGQTLVYRVEDRFTQKTGMGGIFKTVSSRNLSTKRHQVKSIDARDVITLVQILDSAKTWTQVDEEDPVEFDSRSGDQPPEEYKWIAKMVGVPQLLYRITPQGKIVERRSYFADWNVGTGGAFVPFPEDAIPLGFTWYVNDNVQAEDADGKPHRIRLRNAFTLSQVSEGKAKIDFRTEVLTPTTPKLKSQILQHLVTGSRIFDIQRGCFLKTTIEWNETVQGFKTSDSMIEYLRKIQETLVEQPEEFAAGKGNRVETGPVVLRTSSDPPVYRLR